MNKNINERLKITVIGCGQAGGSITARIEESVNDLGGNKANTSFVGINTSTEDLASVKLSHKIHMNNSKGAACNRENGVQDLAESIDTILDELHSYIIEDSIVFIATSLGGGTGSAIAPQLAEILLDEGYKVGMIVVLPADNESLKIRDNARQTFYEIEELKPRMGSIYILDNNATEKMKINSTFASLFASILCINNKSQDGNMDLAEIEACLLTPSFSIITRANKNNGTTANIIDVLNRDSNIFAKREDKTITTMGISEAVSAKESKREMIYRASDGAVLTKLNPGDKVFTNEMTENLWKMAQMNPAQMYAGQFTPVTPDFSKSVNNSSNIEVTFGDLVLPDVTNSAEFADSVESVMREAICRNGKTTQCITEAVSAKQLGKNGIGNARLYK